MAKWYIEKAVTILLHTFDGSAAAVREDLIQRLEEMLKRYDWLYYLIEFDNALYISSEELSNSSSLQIVLLNHLNRRCQLLRTKNIHELEKLYFGSLMTATIYHNERGMIVDFDWMFVPSFLSLQYDFSRELLENKWSDLREAQRMIEKKIESKVWYLGHLNPSSLAELIKTKGIFKREMDYLERLKRDLASVIFELGEINIKEFTNQLLELGSHYHENQHRCKHIAKLEEEISYLNRSKYLRSEGKNSAVQSFDYKLLNDYIRPERKRKKYLAQVNKIKFKQIIGLHHDLSVPPETALFYTEELLASALEKRGVHNSSEGSHEVQCLFNGVEALEPLDQRSDWTDLALWGDFEKLTLFKFQRAYSDRSVSSDDLMNSAKKITAMLLQFQLAHIKDALVKAIHSNQSTKNATESAVLNETKEVVTENLKQISSLLSKTNGPICQSPVLELHKRFPTILGICASIQKTNSFDVKSVCDKVITEIESLTL